MAYVVQLKDFEGPLDLLLHLIGRAKVRIEDIFVSEITEQYLASVQDLSGLDMDAASEFLQMAATLMEIKSRALLPKPPKDEEEDPKEELLRRLEEYRQIKEASKALRIYEAEAAEMVARLPMEIVTDARVELGRLSLRALQEAAREAMGSDVRVDGQMNLLFCSEFTQQSLRRLMRYLDRPQEVYALLQRAGTRVLLGSESGVPALRDTGLAIAHYTVRGRDAGAIAVLGPMRMNYPRLLGLLDYAARSVSRMLTELMDLQ